MKKALGNIGRVIFNVCDYFMYRFAWGHLWGDKSTYIWRTNAKPIKINKDSKNK